MTKQFKKGLVAVLVVLMAVMVGFTANAVIGASKADDKPNEVVEFERNVKLLPDLAKEQENKEYLFIGIMGEEQKNLAEAQKVWNAYNSAKLQIPDLASYAYIEQIDKTLLTKFNKYDAIFNNKSDGDAYAQLLRFRNTMKRIADKIAPYTTYDAGHQLVEQLGKDIEQWQKEAETDKKKDSIYYYIKYSSSDFNEYKRAKKVMESFEEQFSEIGKFLESIEYYDEDAKTMKGAQEGEKYDPDDEKQTIVLASKDSIDNVTNELEELDEADRKYIKGSDEQDNFAKYNAALEALNAWDVMVQEVIDAIEEAYQSKENDDPYYTVKGLIDAANEAFKALEAESRYEGGEDTQEDYNDLASKVTNKNKLDELLEYLGNIDVSGVESLINAVPELEEANYTIEYRNQIEAAEAAFDKLDAEIKEHDQKVYNGEYEDDETYIVKGYDKLRKSREQYDEWTDYIRGLLDKVKEIIRLQQDPEINGKGVSALLSELNEPYTTSGEPWKGKEPKYHKNAFLYAVNSNNDQDIAENEERVYIKDDKYGEKYNFLIMSPYTSKPVEKGEEGNVIPIETTAYDVLSYFYMLKDEIADMVSDIESEIKQLEDDINKLSQGCAFGERDQLLEVWDEYNALGEYEYLDDVINLKEWVGNSGVLEALYEEYLAEDALVKAWVETLDALTTPVSVGDFDKIAAAEEAFKAIVHQETQANPEVAAIDVVVDFSKFLEEKMEDHDEIKLDYSKDYEAYKKVIAARDFLIQAIEDVAEEMGDIDTNDSTDNLPLDQEQIETWAESVEKVSESYGTIADEKTDEDNNVDYTGAQEYLQENYGEGYANFIKALRLVDKYAVELAIEALPEAEDVTLANGKAINEAWKKHNDYLTKYHTSEAENTDEWRESAPHGDFRNDDKLHACWDRLNEINAELNAWMREVVALYDEATAEDPDFTKVTESLKSFLENYEDETDGYKGYPLDLEAYKKVLDAFLGVITNGSTSSSYGQVDKDKVEYVKDAKAVLDKLNEKSNEVINGLNDRISALADEIEENNGELTAENIDEVAAIEDLYNALHETQQAKIKGYDDVLADARETLVAVESFQQMVSSLYDEVITHNNVTSFVQFYIDLVRTTFAQFNDDIRKAFDDVESVLYIAPEGYTKNMEAIQAAYDAAFEAGTVVRLSELKDAFEKAQKELIDALNGLGQMDEEDASNALQEAFKNFENRITGAYTAMIEDKISELEGALNGKDEELQGAIDELKASIENITKEGGDLDKIREQMTQFETKVNGILDEKLGELNGTVEELLKAEQEAREAGDTAQAEALKEAREALQAAIDQANTAINGNKSSLTDLVSKVNAAQTAADNANAAIENLREEMKKADAELKQEIDGLKSTTTTLTILVIVLGVLVLAAVACIVILFIKRK